MARFIPAEQLNDTDLGTVAHKVLELALMSGKSPAWWEGRKVTISEERTHSVLSPSSADRWMTCTGSIDFIAQLDLEEATRPDWSTAVPKSVVDAVLVAADYIRGFSSRPGAELLVEHSLTIPETGEGGHLDAAVILPVSGGVELHVFDYKNGTWRVDPEDNRQMKLYMLGLLEYLGRAKPLKGLRGVTLHIVQPRAENVSAWAFPVKELTRWRTEVRDRTAEVHSGAGELRPSEKGCRWCPGKQTGRCPALARMAAETAKLDFDGFLSTPSPQPAEKRGAKPAPSPLSSEELAVAWQNLWALQAFTKGVTAEAFARLAKGEAVGDLKLVAGRRGNRAWADPATAIAALKRAIGDMDAYMPRSLISPTQAEALLAPDVREALLAPLTVRADGKPTIAPGNDPRPPMTLDSAHSDFNITAPEGEDA